MAVPGGMSKALYQSLSKPQKLIYLALVAAAAAFIGYIWFFY